MAFWLFVTQLRVNFVRQISKSKLTTTKLNKLSEAEKLVNLSQYIFIRTIK